MLRDYNLAEYMSKLRTILECTDSKEPEQPKEVERIMLKQACLGFIGNLCNDQVLRGVVSTDTEGILSACSEGLRTELKERSASWQETVSRQLAVMANVSLESGGQARLIDMGIIPVCETVVRSCTFKGEESELITRTLNILSKVCKQVQGAEQAALSKHIVLTVLLYFQRGYPTLYLNCLRTFHSLCR